MDGQQLRLGPFAKLWQLSIRREAPDLYEDLLSGCEVGQRQTQTEQRGVSSVLTMWFPRERRQVIDGQS